MVRSNSINFNHIYLKWLKENMDQYYIAENNTYRLTLPFLDRNNDFIEIYIIDNNDGTFYITDDGATLNDLHFSGLDINSSPKRKSILNSIISSYGIIKTDDNELIIKCTEETLAIKKHMLIQGMIKISDMFYLSKTNVQSVFLDDVKYFLNEHKIRYSENIYLMGKSKLTNHYDFIINGSENSCEKLIKVVNTINLTSAKNIIFAWNDTKDSRSNDAKLYTFINNVNEKAISALKEYGIYPAIWSEKENYIAELSA